MKENLESLLQRILLEKRVPNITELVAVLKEADDESEASRIMKRTILTSLGFGEIGSKYPVTLNNTFVWCDLVSLYLRSKNELGIDHSFTKSIRILVVSSTFHLISRSFTRENSSRLFDYLYTEWHVSS